MIKHGPVDGVVLVINFMCTALTIFSLVVMVLLILNQNIFGKNYPTCFTIKMQSDEVKLEISRKIQHLSGTGIGNQTEK